MTSAERGIKVHGNENLIEKLEEWHRDRKKRLEHISRPARFFN
jgi:hypothetical protein